MQVDFTVENREKLRFSKFAYDCEYRKTEKIRNKKTDICHFAQVSHCTLKDCKEKGRLQ